MLVPTSGERLAAEGVSPYGRQKKLASLGFVVVGFGRSCFAGASVLPRRAEAAAADVPQVLDGFQLEIRLKIRLNVVGADVSAGIHRRIEQICRIHPA